MKKLTAMILALTIVLTIAGAAMAEFTGRTPIHLITDDATRSHTVTSPVTKHGDYWAVSIDESTSNIFPTHRVVVRVHRGANGISATWVYSGNSDAPHSYSIAGTVDNVTLRVRLDTRDPGTMMLHGWFYY